MNTGCNPVGSLTCTELAAENATDLVFHVAIGGSEAYSRLAQILERNLAVMVWVRVTHLVTGSSIVGALSPPFMSFWRVPISARPYQLFADRLLKVPCDAALLTFTLGLFFWKPVL